MDSPPAPLETHRAQRVFFLFLFGERPKRNKPKPFGQLLLRFVFFLQGTANLLFSDEIYFMFAVACIPFRRGISTANIKKRILCVLCGSAVNINPKKECLNNYCRISIRRYFLKGKNPEWIRF